MNEGEFLKTVSDLMKLDPEEYRVKVAKGFRDFIRLELETKLRLCLIPEKYAQGVVFRHRSDLLYVSYDKPLLYVETKIISRPERVGPDYDKRMYQIALASVDLKMKDPSTSWQEYRGKPPYVIFALAIPKETPSDALARVNQKMSRLLGHYLDACCLYIYDIREGRRRDDFLTDSNLSINSFLSCLVEKRGSQSNLDLGL